MLIKINLSNNKTIVLNDIAAINNIEFKGLNDEEKIELLLNSNIGNKWMIIKKESITRYINCNQIF